MSTQEKVKYMAMAKSMRATTWAVLILYSATAAVSSAFAADAHVPVIRVAASDAASRFIPLGVGKSVAIDLPEDIRDVLVADPKIANAVIRSSRRVYMIGVKVGQTNIFFFNTAGRQIAGFDIAVTRDLNGVRAALKRTLPDANIQIEGVGDGVMLTGTASSPAESQQAFDIASQLVGNGSKVVNGIRVRTGDQVTLKVTVAEVQRQVIKQLGINLNASIGYGTVVLKTNNPFSATGVTPNNSIAAQLPESVGGNTIGATLQAMDSAGVTRILAEPTLTAISGETADFLVGGQFPYPVPATCSNCPPSIEFKNFGVSLKFTPIVLSEGRISLKVMTEVSALSTENSVSVGGNAVPSLTVRRAQTTLEIPSGGSLALAGLLQQQSKQAIAGWPALMQVPILGTLFKSRDYLNNQTELVILINPYIVRAVAANKLLRPDDGFADPSDPSAVFLGHLNRIYGVHGKAELPNEYHGKYGFILD